MCAGLSVTASRLAVSVERPGRCTGAIVDTTVCASCSVVTVPVVERGAPGVVAVVVINCVVVVPIKSPIVPAPPKSSVEADAEADSERKVRTAIPDSRIGVPARPWPYGTAINQPGIVGGDVNDIGVSRLNDDCRVLGCYCLLRRGLKIARLLGSLAHHLNCVHYVLLLVIVGIA